MRIVPSKNPKCVSVLVPSTRSHSALMRSLAAAIEIHPRDILKLEQVNDSNFLVEKVISDDVDVTLLKSGTTVNVVSKNAMDLARKYDEGVRKGMLKGYMLWLLLFTVMMLWMGYIRITGQSQAAEIHTELSNRINTLEQNLVILLNGAASQNSKTFERVEQLKLFVDRKLLALSDVVLTVKDSLARVLQKVVKFDGSKKSKQLCRESSANVDDD